jgi:MFS family permease
MARKIAAVSALLVFGISILSGLHAQNTFSTTLSRALQGMAIAFIVGLLIGLMADRMFREHLEAEAKKNKFSEVKPGPDDR